jgi:hypothetical protein
MKWSSRWISLVSIKDECTLAWLVDLEKVYDSIWREGLMVKLYNMGIKGKIWRWINNFLSGRITRL